MIDTDTLVFYIRKAPKQGLGGWGGKCNPSYLYHEFYTLDPWSKFDKYFWVDSDGARVDPYSNGNTSIQNQITTFIRKDKWEF